MLGKVAVNKKISRRLGLLFALSSFAWNVYALGAFVYRKMNQKVDDSLRKKPSLRSGVIFTVLPVLSSLSNIYKMYYRKNKFASKYASMISGVASAKVILREMLRITYYPEIIYAKLMNNNKDYSFKTYLKKSVYLCINTTNLLLAEDNLSGLLEESATKKLYSKKNLDLSKTKLPDIKVGS